MYPILIEFKLFLQVKDFAHLVHAISHVLRPGGLIELVEVDFSVYTPERQRLELNLNRMEEPYLPRWFAFMRMAALQRGGDVDASNYIHSWVHEQGVFENVVYREYWVPTCPWGEGTDLESKWWNSVGETSRDSLLVS
jgi:hypothetical protein